MTNESEKKNLREFLARISEEERLDLLLAEIEGRLRDPSDKLVQRTYARIQKSIEEFDAANLLQTRLNDAGAHGHEPNEISSASDVSSHQTKKDNLDPEIISLPSRLSVKQGWTPVTAVIEGDQRLAASGNYGRQRWVPFDIIDDIGRAAKLRALFRDDGSARLRREDSRDCIVGVFDAAGEKVAELTKKNDEALVFLGGGRRAVSELVVHLQLKFRVV